MKPIIVSACLLGENCKYNGGNNYNAKIEALKAKFELIPICPEVFGGLSIPRDPSEIKDGRVINNKGIDVTDNFIVGANKALAIAKEHNAKIALLKESSPSCGVNLIYDGSFNGVKINGLGVTAKLFKENGIDLYTENDIDKLLEK